MSKVKEAVDYMVRVGTAKTFSGNYHFDFDEIEEKFGVNIDDEFKDEVVKEAMGTGKVLDIETEEDFDFMFGLAYCPYAEDDENEEVTVDELLDKAEELGWKAEKTDYGCSFQKYSPAGQDFCFDISKAECYDASSLVNTIYSYYEAYDPSEEAYLWLDSSGHGKNGAPYEMCDVYADMKACKESLLELWRMLKEMIE